MPENQYMQPFFDSLSQGVQVAQHLTQAALQMRQLQQEKEAQQQRQALAQQEFDAQQQQSLGQQLASGAKPVDGSGDVQMPAPAAANPNFGMPGMGDQPVSLPQSGNTNVPADTSRTYQVGGQTLQAPTLQDQLDRQVASKKALEDADRIPISDKLANAIGVPPGTKLSPEHLAGVGSLARWMNPPQQDKSPSYEDFKDNDSGHVTRVWSDSEGNPTKKVDMGKLVGEKASGDGTGKQLTPDAVLGARQKAIADYQKASREEAELNQDRVAIGTALKTGQHYLDKNGNLKKFDPASTDEEKAAIQDSMRQVYDQKTKRLAQVISEKNDAMQRYGTTPKVSTEDAVRALGGSASAPAAGDTKQAQQPQQTNPAAAAPAAAPANKPAPANQPAPQRKVASMADISAYAKKQNITVDAAKKIALGKGYEIGQ